MAINDGKPYDEKLPNGTQNPSSYAFTASVGMTTLAWDRLHRHAPATMRTKQAMTALASLYLNIADDVQIGLRNGAAPDRMAASHTRCRGALYSALVQTPEPFDQPAEMWVVWREQMVRRTTVMLEVAAVIAATPPAELEPNFEILAGTGELLAPPAKASDEPSDSDHGLGEDEAA